MGELLNLYNNIESPLRNPQVIQKIISAWSFNSSNNLILAFSSNPGNTRLA